MITPRLEELILQGLAKYKNFAGGWGAIYTIPVPEGKQIVITDISLTNFVNVADGAANYSNIALKITDNLVSNTYLFSTYLNDGTTQPIDQRLPVKLDTYMLCKADTRLRFAFIPIAAATLDFTVPTAEENEPNAPIGYGGIPVLRAFKINTTNVYMPIGIKGTPTVGMTNEPFPDIDINSAIRNPANANDGFTFNIGYVIINIPSINN